jgi:hypothetical protein
MLLFGIRQVDGDAQRDCDHARLVNREPSEIAAGVRETGDKSSADRIDYVGKHDRDCVGFMLQGRRNGP